MTNDDDLRTALTKLADDAEEYGPGAWVAADLRAVLAAHPIESWRPIVGHEGLYEVSDQGHVRSLDRPDAAGRWVHGRAVQPVVHHRGHLRVSLWSGGRRTQVFVHRLVLEAFRGSAPAGMEACHNDGNPTNNRLDNLRWDTQSANQLDRVRHGTHNNASKTHCPAGHPYDANNTHVDPSGHRSCRACMRKRSVAARLRGATRG